MAGTVLTAPTHVTTLDGERVPFHMSVASVNFSAHADYKETSEFVRELRPSHVILVHGSFAEMCTFVLACVTCSWRALHKGNNTSLATPPLAAVFSSVLRAHSLCLCIVDSLATVISLYLSPQRVSAAACRDSTATTR